jgi:hypothetical protein
MLATRTVLDCKGTTPHTRFGRIGSAKARTIENVKKGKHEVDEALVGAANATLHVHEEPMNCSWADSTMD